MAKKKSWFSLIKGLFISDSKAKHEKREKRRRWVFGRFKWRRLPTITAPLSPAKDRALSEAEREHSRHALNVAVATAAAAEAAVAATQAAVEIIRLTGTTSSIILPNRTSQELAAVKIQTAFRGYLARKALRALKGLVRLQAMIRGQVVRRQAMTTLKGLQSLVKIQTQVRATRARLLENGWTAEEKQQLLGQEVLEGNEAKIELNGEKLICHIPTSEEKRQLHMEKELEENGKKLKLNFRRKFDDSKAAVDATLPSRELSLNKRDRIKEFLLSHQERRNSKRLTESKSDRANLKLGHWLEQWIESHDQKGVRSGLFDSIVSSNSTKRNAEEQMVVAFRELQDCEQLEDLTLQPRRSFHKPIRSSVGEHDSLGSPGIPNYMLATESVKAKLRSSSTPRQRRGFLEAFSDIDLPSKNRLSFSSINSDATSTVKIGKAGCSQQISPRLRGFLAPASSHRSAKDLSFNSDCSLLNYDQRGNLR
ncbi:hypothetical protein Scep_013994 [Stephania cephalantha]|uniref:DUF4005 domain-containing protein n=1 Tax=Stephania cephalantha TaxID=152367 RepID=A0AAP0J291_9MAGN